MPGIAFEWWLPQGTAIFLYHGDQFGCDWGDWDNYYCKADKDHWTEAWQALWISGCLPRKVYTGNIGTDAGENGLFVKEIKVGEV